jgi:mannosylglycerate hydrolase
VNGTLFVLAHTHWDREWYLPFSTFRVRLAGVVGTVLADLEAGRLEHFVLDGQAILLEDLLELRPELEPRLRTAVASGRLGIGPWYTLPDEFLVGGEALARNLLHGRTACRRFGEPSPVGYLPDTFGHVAQLPQILARAGIESFVYWRGHGDEVRDLPTEWRWEAPDGSAVLALRLAGGYCHGAALGYGEIWEVHHPRAVDLELALRQARERIASVVAASRGRVWALPAGCDHHPPQRRLDEILAGLRAAEPGLDLRQAGLEEWVAAVAAQELDLPSWRGELRGGREAHLLSGVLSARGWIKRRDEQLQTLLAGRLEPLVALGRLRHGLPAPRGSLALAWRTLLANHPHDSICGCSVDEVHREMATRYDQVEQLAVTELAVIGEACAPLFAPGREDDGRTVIDIFNPLPFPRRALAERLVILLPEQAPLEDLELVDEAGRPVPFRAASRRWLQRFWNVDYRSLPTAREQRTQLETYLELFRERIVRQRGDAGLVDQVIELQALVELPPTGHARLQLRPRRGAAVDPLCATGPVQAEVSGAEGAWIENEALKVWLRADGRFDLLHKGSGRRFQELGLFEDGEDAGDEYDWSPAPEGETLGSAGLAGRLELVECTGLAATLRVDLLWELPVALSPDRRRRMAERLAVPLRVELRLRAAAPWLELRVELDNRVRDHRLRMLFPTGIVTDRLWSDGAFETRSRPLVRPGGEDWVQPPLGTVPQGEFSLVEDAAGGLALLNRGLPEIEALVGGDGGVTLAQTLLRGVEWLSRDDFPTRNFGNAGPTLHTPEAQEQGRQAFELALLPYTGTWLEAGVRRASREWRLPAGVRQGVANGALPTAWLVGQRDPAAISMTAIKLHEERDTLVLRLVNHAGELREERLDFPAPPCGAWRCTLLEDRLEPLPLAGTALPLELGPHEILTVEVAWEPESGI